MCTYCNSKEQTFNVQEAQVDGGYETVSLCKECIEEYCN